MLKLNLAKLKQIGHCPADCIQVILYSFRDIFKLVLKGLIMAESRLNLVEPFFRYSPKIIKIFPVVAIKEIALIGEYLNLGRFKPLSKNLYDSFS